MHTGRLCVGVVKGTHESLTDPLNSLSPCTSSAAFICIFSPNYFTVIAYVNAPLV